MRRRLLLGAAGVVTLIAAWVVWLLNAAGEFRALAPHFDGSCMQVAGLVGTEDLTIHPRTGVAYLSSCDFRSVLAGRPAKCSLYAYDLNAASPRPVDLVPNADPGFRPHGISLHLAEDGTATIFAINHAAGRHTIEVYDVGAAGLRHRQTIADPALVSPNDLVAVTPTQVYVTNDHRHPPGPMRAVEEYLRRPWANVVLWDGHAFREAAGGIRFANGINVSRDRTTVYVASLIGKEIRVYGRDPATGALALRAGIPLGTGPDNIEVAEDGTLWIGAHPRLLTVARYMSGAVARTPSQVLHVVPGRDGGEVHEVYLNVGEELSGASVAAVRGRRLLIGPIADSKFLDCTMH